MRNLIFMVFFFFLLLSLKTSAKTLIDCGRYIPLPANASFQEAANQVNGNVDCLRINLNNGLKNKDGIKRIAEIIALGSTFAGSGIPPSTASTAEIALIGKDSAGLKFKSLLVALSVTLMELSATYERIGEKTCGVRCKEIFEQVNQLTSLGHQTFFLGYGSSEPVNKALAREKADEYVKILGNGLAAQVNEQGVEILWKDPHKTIVKYPNQQDCILAVEVLNGVVSSEGTDLDFICR